MKSSFNPKDYRLSPKYKFNIERAKLDQEYKIQLDILKRNLKLEQDKCSHNDSTFHPDHSGNNDSFSECNWCGKEI